MDLRNRIEAVRASAWGGLMLRALAAMAALCALAAIGHATAGGSTARAASAVTQPSRGHDGGSSEAPAERTAPTPAGLPATSAAALPSPVATPCTSSRGPGAGRATPEDPVHLNEADEAALRRLPGVGAKRAAAILEERARRGGRFKRIEELMKVKGIGRAAIKKWRPLVRLDAV